MGQAYFDQSTKHLRLAHHMRALLSLVQSLNQAQAAPGNQTHPTCPGQTGGRHVAHCPAHMIVSSFFFLFCFD
jgi:hypothetical protein